jgi:hypothetical protein
VNDDLGAVLRSLFAAADPVPPAALRAASSAIGWRHLDRELARLTSDTTERELAHVRGRPPRLLSFSSGTTTIELELSAGDGTVKLLGQLDPPVAAGVTAESAAGTVTARADDRGRFRLEAAASTWLRLAVDPPGDGGQRLITEWFPA